MASVESGVAVADRERSKAEWLDRLTSLVNSVEVWARELGWSTRRIEKGLEDAEVGPYQAPALLLQESTTKALLDPIGRSTVGSDGVVDLYLMPAFDDVARLCHRDGRWWLLSEADDAEPVPLARESLRDVLESLKVHAG